MPDPIDAIQALILKRMTGGFTLGDLARESHISRPMLHAILHDHSEPGRDTLALLVAWSPEFEPHVMRYLRVHGQWLTSSYTQEESAA